MNPKRFTNPDMGISGVAPEGWTQAHPGIWLRRASEADPTHLVQQRVGGMSLDEVMALAVSEEGLDELPGRAGTIEGLSLPWDWYRGNISGPAPKVVDIALSRRENWVYVVALVTTPGETHDLHEAVFLPAVKALAPAAPDAAYARQLEEHVEEHRQMIRANRDALRNGPWPDFPTQSDQQRGLPMPPPQQPHDVNAQWIDLPAPDRAILTKPDLFACIADRESQRKYTGESLTLPELAYLLWATQGVRKVIMGGKGSLRTVPSSGARHPFETYLAINRVRGVAPGVYRYLPFEHRLVHLFAGENLAEKLGELALDQPFVGQAAVCFIWSAVPYRQEWRYGTQGAKGTLLDAGHVCQNLYLACESIGCGTCAIAAYRQEDLDRYLGLDGEEELVVYLAPVGKVAESTRSAENARPVG
jgi:SagB-type dehydrogenase family enzyme